MISFDLKNFQRIYQQINITCNFEGLAFIGITKYLTPSGLCLQVPTTRIKASLLEMLNKNVFLEIKTVTIDAYIGWYTIEGDKYNIGIIIHKQHIPAWKRLRSESGDVDVAINTGMNHAQI